MLTTCYPRESVICQMAVVVVVQYDVLNAQVNFLSTTRFLTPYAVTRLFTSVSSFSSVH